MIATSQGGMTSSSTAIELQRLRSGEFQTTHWSVVLRARGGSAQSAEALEKLCRAYWRPLFAYVRRQGHDVHAAQDLTQEFFARLLAGGSLATVEPEKNLSPVRLIARWARIRPRREQE